jgi:PAS domain S-box-containing protein
VNLLLSGLPTISSERLRGSLELVEMRLGDVLFAANRNNEHVYFPLTSRIALSHFQAGARLIDISLVGNEGVIGIPLMLIGTVVPVRATVHTAGSAYRMRKHLFQQELNRGGPLLRNFIHYAGRLMTQMEQSGYCDVHGPADPAACGSCQHHVACPQHTRPAVAHAAPDCALPVTNKWPVFASNGTLSGIVGARAGAAAVDAAHDSLALIGCGFAHAREAIMITDADCRVIEANDACTRMTGHAREDIVGKDLRSLQSSNHDRPFDDAMWDAIAQHGYWTGEVSGRRPNGQRFPEMLTISAVRAEGGDMQHYVAIFSDISDTGPYRSRPGFVAQHDVLFS